MRCVIAMMQHETNTFSPLPTTINSFASGVGLDLPPCGEEAIKIYGKADFGFAALIDIATQNDADIVVPITAYAEPSGKVENEAFEYICEKICQEVINGCDAVLLDLHGAMVTETFSDGEGELLKRIRRIHPTVPIAVCLDMHTNLTKDMVNNSTVIDGYRTYPHIDMYDAGKRAAESLFHILKNQLSTKISWRKLPLMTHMLNQTPLQQPMKDIMREMVVETDWSSILNAAIFTGFPLADIPHLSFSAIAVEETQFDESEQLLNRLMQMTWSRRQDFVFEAEDLSSSIAYAKSLKNESREKPGKRPVLIADHGDNSGAGGSADDMTVLTEMLNQGLSNIVVGPIWDPVSVEKIINQGIGTEIILDVGGKTDAPTIGQSGCPLRLTGIISNITDGRFTITGPMQHGLQVNLGRCAVLTTPELEILISEERWEPYDPGCFTHAGLNPYEKDYILIKSRQHFRATFESIASHIVLAAGPGVCSSDYSQFNFEHIPHPIYPIDNETQWNGEHLSNCLK